MFFSAISGRCCEARDGMLQQPDMLDPPCQTLLTPSPSPSLCICPPVIFPGPRVSRLPKKKGKVTNAENRDLTNRPPPLQPQTHSSAHRPTYDPVCVLFLAAGCPQCCLLTYGRPSPSSHWIGRIERRARAPPPHTHAGRKDLTTTAICFPSFSYAPYLWWRGAVCAACVLYV